MSTHPDGPGLATIAARSWLGGMPQHRPLSPTLEMATAWQAPSSVELAARFHDEPDSGFYARFGHPTIRGVERLLARIEGTEDALLFPSGMSAITTTVLALARPGGRIVAQRRLFAQTFQFLAQLATRAGLGVDFVDAEGEELAAALQREATLVVLETPSNPLLRLADVAAASRLAHASGALLLVDATFASPVVQRTAELGADVVLHSGSKFLNGHGDVLCGVAAGSGRLLRDVAAARVILGGVPSPHAAWLLQRGLRTLPLRVHAQCRNALAAARMLDAHPKVSRVHYPGLTGFPQRELAERQMSCGGGMVSFELAGGLPAARRLLDGLRVIAVASSLGSVESVVEIPADLDFAEAKLGDAAEGTGIPKGLIRFSLGIEDERDILADLEGALAGA